MYLLIITHKCSFVHVSIHEQQKFLEAWRVVPQHVFCSNRCGVCLLLISSNALSLPFTLCLVSFSVSFHFSLSLFLLSLSFSLSLSLFLSFVFFLSLRYPLILGPRWTALRMMKEARQCIHGLHVEPLLPPRIQPTPTPSHPRIIIFYSLQRNPYTINSPPRVYTAKYRFGFLNTFYYCSFISS